MSTLTILIQYSFGIPSYSNQRTNWSKVNPNWKRKKLNCHCSQMTWYYTYKILDASRKLLELINESGKVESYKINIQKPIAFLYTNNKRSEREIQEAIPFTIASKRKKYPEINLPKETKDLYSKDCKMLIKGIKKKHKQMERYICGLEELILLKWLYYPGQSTDSMESLIKLPMVFSTELEETISKFVQTQKTPNS